MTEPPSSPEDPSVTFRRKSTVAFRVFVVVMSLVAVGSAVLGWWIGAWWGLAIGVVVGLVVLVGGLVGGTLMWAMTQDGA